MINAGKIEHGGQMVTQVIKDLVVIKAHVYKELEIIIWITNDKRIIVVPSYKEFKDISKFCGKNSNTEWFTRVNTEVGRFFDDETKGETDKLQEFKKELKSLIDAVALETLNLFQENMVASSDVVLAYPRSETKSEDGEKPRKPTELEEFTPTEEDLEAVKNPALLEDITDEFNKIFIGNRKLFQTLILSGIGVFKEIEFHVNINGTKGAAKTSIAEFVIKVLPDQLPLSDDMSPKSIYYSCLKNPLAMDKKIIVLDDVDENLSEAHVSVLKSFSSNKHPRSLVTVKNQDALSIQVEGYMALWTTSLNPIANDQVQDRFWATNIEDDQDIRKDIMFLKQRSLISSNLANNTLANVKNKLKNILATILKAEYNGVIIPYAYLLDFSIFNTKTELKNRLMDQFANLIKLSAIFHRYQRSITDKGQIVANLNDLDLAYNLIKDVFEINISPIKLSSLQKEILDILPYKEYDDKGLMPDGLTYDMLMKETDKSHGTLRNNVSRLSGGKKPDGSYYEQLIVSSKGGDGTKEFWKIRQSTKSFGEEKVMSGTSSVVISDVREIVEDILYKNISYNNNILCNYNNNIIIESIKEDTLIENINKIQYILSLSHVKNDDDISNKAKLNSILKREAPVDKDGIKVQDDVEIVDFEMSEDMEKWQNEEQERKYDITYEALVELEGAWK